MTRDTQYRRPRDNVNFCPPGWPRRCRPARRRAAHHLIDESMSQHGSFPALLPTARNDWEPVRLIARATLDAPAQQDVA